MKKLLFLSVFTLFSLSVIGQGIEFVHVKWQEAVEMAKTENKLLFVDSYAEWCGPCKRMAKNEFVKPEVGKVYNKNFINLKLDMESKNGRTFDSQYPVSAYPTMFFLDGNGKVVRKVKGGKKGDQLIAMANAVLKSYDTSGQFQDKYDEGDRSYETIYSLVEALNKADKPSLKISNEYLKSNPEITEEQRLKFYHVATVDADSRIFDKMVENKAGLIKLIGAEAYDEKVRSACDNTIQKAVEFETESLLEEATQKGEAALTTGGKEYALKATFEYATEMKDIPKFETSAKGLTKIYLKKDPALIKNIIVTMHKKFGNNPKMIKLSSDLSKKYFKKTKSVDSALSYAKSLILLEEYEEASKVLDKAMKNAAKNDESTKSLEMMINVLEKKKA